MRNHSAYLNYIGTAVPENNAHQGLLESLPHWMAAEKAVKLRQIAEQSQIESRYSVLDTLLGPPGSEAFYPYGQFPTTQTRMAAYRRHALPLALQAVKNLGGEFNPSEITHLIVTSCTGFYAPGLDIDLVKALGLPTTTKRSLLGFMGCYAGITGIRHAREMILADSMAKVLMVNLELCSLHLQQTTQLDRLVSFILFADGAAASVFSSTPVGLRLDSTETFLSLADADKMAWTIEDQGFAMTLDARVPQKIKHFLQNHSAIFHPPHLHGESPALYAIHPGGKAILDAVQTAGPLQISDMVFSRNILKKFGNLSSASILFVLNSILDESSASGPGIAMAFGPGLTLETLNFTKT